MILVSSKPLNCNQAGDNDAALLPQQIGCDKIPPLNHCCCNFPRECTLMQQRRVFLLKFLVRGAWKYEALHLKLHTSVLRRFQRATKCINIYNYWTQRRGAYRLSLSWTCRYFPLQVFVWQHPSRPWLLRSHRERPTRAGIRGTLPQQKL